MRRAAARRRLLAGGKCCYGHDPLHLCACAHPDYDCAERYGCG